MQLADLKRAVEDVLLQPESNNIGQMNGRASLAALDLCQASTSSSCPPCTSASSGSTSVATRTCSSSSETVAAASANLATSTSLDHIMLRDVPGPMRSGGVSRRSSRILPHHATTSKRKRSNSLTSGYRGPNSSGLPPPSSLPQTARATPFREGDGAMYVYTHGYQHTAGHTHKHSLGSSESSATDDGAMGYGDEYLLGGPGLLLPTVDVGTNFQQSEHADTIDGIHEDEEMECD